MEEGVDEDEDDDDDDDGDDEETVTAEEAETDDANDTEPPAKIGGRVCTNVTFDFCSFVVVSVARRDGPITEIAMGETSSPL